MACRIKKFNIQKLSSPQCCAAIYSNRDTKSRYASPRLEYRPAIGARHRIAAHSKSMIAHRHPNNIWLYPQPVDMRKSFDGLIAACTQFLQENPVSGDYFIFINKRKTHLKLLCWQPCGYFIWYKRLEQGQFNWPTPSSEKTQLTPIDFQLMLSGIQIKKYRQFKRFSRDIN